MAFRAIDGGIRFGLDAIRNIGPSVAAAIIVVRDSDGPFTSFADFLERIDASCCNKRVVESLIKAGVFDSLGHTRNGLMLVCDQAVEAAVQSKQAAAIGQMDLFMGCRSPDGSVLAHLVPKAQEWPLNVLLRHERDMLGRYVSAHPLDGAEDILRRVAPQPIAALLEAAPSRGTVTVAGVVVGIEQRVNKHGQPWTVVTVEDLDAALQVTFFARDYQQASEVLTLDATVAITGEVTWRDDSLSLVGSSATVIEQ